ncbi:MAG: hypothetical protein JW936_10215 [Sedimentisphaerales bacterium]|nr:hypothetical protein [Sedimentisphaerales bacterium]
MKGATVRQYKAKRIRWMQIAFCLVAMIALRASGDVVFFEDFVDDTYKTRPEYSGYTEEWDGGYEGMVESYAEMAWGPEPSPAGGILGYKGIGYLIWAGVEHYYSIQAPEGMAFSNIVITYYCWANTGYQYAWTGVRAAAGLGYAETKIVDPDGGSTPFQVLTLDLSGDEDFFGAETINVSIYANVYYEHSGTDAKMDWLKVEADLVSADLTSCDAVLAQGWSLGHDINNDCTENLTEFAAVAVDWMTCVDPNDPTCDEPWFD